MAPLPLPAGWLVRVSRSKGKTFYINTFTKGTQWTRPTEPAEPEQAYVDEEAPANKRQRLEQEDGKDACSTEAAITRCMRVGAMLSPWPHQVNAVQKLLIAITSDDRAAGVETFLLQHSTGSGKTVTMAALAYQLLYAVDKHGSRFHTVVVLIDRIKLDEQVGGAIELFLRRNGIHEVFRAESIDHLAKLLDPSQKAAEQRVIITSIQKLGLLVKDPVLVTRLLHRSATRADDKKFDRIAIITDEAHRSHTASTREAIQEVIKAGEGNDTRMTFVGVTATPNIEALHLFGSKISGESRLSPFDCYSIALATKDGRIMDILENYRCIRCDVETTIPPTVIESLRKKGSLRAILDYASDELAVLKAKSLLMMEDFEHMKSTQPRAKCMIVARSRRDVLRYYRLVSAYTSNRSLAWKVYASFSGTLIEDDDFSKSAISEQGVNGPHLTLAISDIVIVCDKLDTGYNDPLLACMYIDRSLRSSSQTVQLLSRLNRRHRAKKRIKIVDFSNHPAQIRRSFADYWKETQAPRASDLFDFETELMNFITGATILCDFFPILWSSCNESQVEVLVKDQVMLLERDAFQQVSSALRMVITAWNRLEIEEGDFELYKFNPVRFDVLSHLKKYIEAYNNNDQELDYIHQIKSKMSSRVSKYEPTFSGPIFPQSLLDLAECDTVSVLSSQLKYGPLELFECCITLLSKKNPGKTHMDVLERVKSRYMSMKSSNRDEQTRIVKHLEELLPKLTEKE